MTPEPMITWAATIGLDAHHVITYMPSTHPEGAIHHQHREHVCGTTGQAIGRAVEIAYAVAQPDSTITVTGHTGDDQATVTRHDDTVTITRTMVL